MSITAPSSKSALTLITSQFLTVPAASFTISNIPGTYNDLILTALLRSNEGAFFDDLLMNFNNDFNAHYDMLGLSVTGTSAPSNTNSYTSDSIEPGSIPAASATANVFGRLRWEINQYTNTAVEKISGIELDYTDIAVATTDSSLIRAVGLWRSTAAINTISIKPNAGTDFVAGSIVYLYGRT